MKSVNNIVTYSYQECCCDLVPKLSDRHSFILRKSYWCQLCTHWLTYRRDLTVERTFKIAEQIKISSSAKPFRFERLKCLNPSGCWFIVKEPVILISNKNMKLGNVTANYINKHALSYTKDNFKNFYCLKLKWNSTWNFFISFWTSFCGFYFVYHVYEV